MRWAILWVVLAVIIAQSAATEARAGGVQTLETVVVTGSAADLLGVADTASQGTVLKQQIDLRPVYRVGELLENTPGLIVTQHSGEGKANQYYLRGFNLDHGTDVAITVDDMPVNMRTHAHGQGYADLNFVIPELASGMQYRKGPYFADQGDFATAGAVQVGYLDKLDRDLAEIGGGSFGYARALSAISRPAGQGNLLMAAEMGHLDGPWQHPDNYNKGNLVLRYSEGVADNGWSATAMGYSGKWNATNQAPSRAMDSGQLSRWGAVDPSDAGSAQRYSLSGRMVQSEAGRRFAASAYVIGATLDLFNNFTYFMDDPVNGDQFHQHETRVVSGGKAAYTLIGKLAGLDTENTVGTEVRDDEIHLGLYHTRNRQYLSTTRTDQVSDRSGAVFIENRTQWLTWLRTVAGLRGDAVSARVKSGNTLNSGAADQSKIYPKGSLILGPWARTELYLSGGMGFHSNDVRSTFTTISPKDGSAQQTFPLLERAIGKELGVRTSLVPGLQTSLALFQLDLASEQVFSGDAGETSPSGKTTRKGIELANFYTPTPGVIIDADVAVSQAKFRTDVSDGITTGSHIAGSPRMVIGAGVALDDFGPWSGGLQYRMFGPRPLSNDNSVRSSATQLVNARVGYKLTETISARLDVDNLFNARSQQIAYYYQSQLKGEAGPSNDVHLHPVEPLGVRVSLLLRW